MSDNDIGITTWSACEKCAHWLDDGGCALDTQEIVDNLGLDDGGDFITCGCFEAREGAEVEDA